MAFLLYLNAALYYRPHYFDVGGQRLNADVLAQLRHLQERMHQGAAADMQELFPEGFVFTNAFYSLSWSEVAAAAPPASQLHQDAVSESRWAVQQIASPQGRAIFNPDLPLPYGAFYVGWLNYALGKQLAAQLPAQRLTADTALFRHNCARLARVLDSTAAPYPETYPNLTWPADVAVGVASLAEHDRLYPPRYQGPIRSWLRRAAALTYSSGLLPHEVEFASGRPREGARGSSQSLLLCLLADIEPTFGRAQFRQYRRHFVDRRLGLPGIREYPFGSALGADVDSGPVIWEIDGAASVVGRRAAQQYGDVALAEGLHCSMETFGLARTVDGKRAYLFGELPLADAFLVWGNAAAIKPGPAPAANWRWRFQLYCLATAAVTGALLFWLWRRPR
ncbi:hypothetical protein DLM85_12870 [Hymenobacter edaphi]|uniref:Uncharacterized protein n=1 Tax=Hymenobacter edaphi TaxID=2211146 RepID=A0A328BMB5_9BACT|nr:hypothetical protein DLM85_12870 [Hymenobacter edaphi]